MRRLRARNLCIASCSLALLWTASPGSAIAVSGQGTHVTVDVDRTSVIRTSEALLTVQVCPEPLMRPGAKLHDQWIAALRDLGMSYARLQPWAPFPRLSIAELQPPRDGVTSWDFSLIDPFVLDFYQAQQGRPIVLNPAIPGWLFEGPPRPLPDDPDQVDWPYEFDPHVGTRFRDPTFRQTAAYFRRFAEWYIHGGFTDEYGKEHRSGHRLKVDYWEVLNEEDEGTAHQIDPPTYTRLYDAVVSSLKKVDPEMKFGGLALSDATSLHYFEYFLNPRNHRPGIPLDMVSYHQYITAERGGTVRQWQRDMFADTDRFLHTVKQIERIRRRLSPRTKTFISEFGIRSGDEAASMETAVRESKPYVLPKIPPDYWTLGASVFAYGYLGAVREGVDMVGAAELVDYPGNVAGTNLIHWDTGEPNAVYRVVKLLHDTLPPGARLLRTTVHGEGVEAQSFDGPTGRKLLLINKTSETIQVTITGSPEGHTTSVDATTGSSPPREGTTNGDHTTLEPHAVMIVAWPEATVGGVPGKPDQ